MFTIIATTNYTKLSENAVEYAAAVARQNHVRMVLLNDFTMPTTGVNARLTGDIIEEILMANEARLNKRAEELAAKYGIEVIPKAIFSYFEDTIKHLITAYSADLVVMGMEPKSVEQDLLGNNTTNVIKKLNTPVLAVPLTASFDGNKKILFACDMINGISEQLLARVKNFSKTILAEVEVLLINETLEELQEAGLNASLKDSIDAGLNGATYFYKNISSDSIINAIANEIVDYQADLLIMAPQKHGFWDSIIHRSKTRIMASGLQIPLLSIPV